MVAMGGINDSWSVAPAFYNDNIVIIVEQWECKRVLTGAINEVCDALVSL